MGELNEGVEVPVEDEEPKEEEQVEQETQEEEECLCYSVDVPENMYQLVHPWKTTYVFGTYECTLCGRRVKK